MNVAAKEELPQAVRMQKNVRIKFIEQIEHSTISRVAAFRDFVQQPCFHLTKV
jgi:hypothetical protein